MSTKGGSATIKRAETTPKLIHPSLHKIPMQIRFFLTGIVGSILFMIAYNWAVTHFEHYMIPSQIYALCYLVYIPFNHFFLCLLVFGWPEGRYIPSLVSNFPIGLTAIAIGAFLTAYLDSIHFNEQVETYVEHIFFPKYIEDSSLMQRSLLHEETTTDAMATASPLVEKMATTLASEANTVAAADNNNNHNGGVHDEEPGELYSSIVVLITTSLWTYCISIFVNTFIVYSAKKQL